jgi:DNA-binding CsgD family transcriptional regulator
MALNMWRLRIYMIEIDKKQVIDLVKKGYKNFEIAKMLNVTSVALIRKCGPLANIATYLEEEIYKQYKEGLTRKELAEKYNLTLYDISAKIRKMASKERAINKKIGRRG